MKLALVYPDLSHKGGAESVVVWTAAGLARRGHRVRVFTEVADPFLWPDCPEFENCLEIVDAVPHRKSFQEKLTRHLLTAEKLGARLSEFPVVYAHNMFGLLWSLKSNSKLLWYCQEPNRTLHIHSTDSILLDAMHARGADTQQPAFIQAQTILRRQSRNWKRRWRTRRRLRRDREWASRPDAVFVNSEFSASCFQSAMGRRPTVLDLGLPSTTLPEVRSEEARSGIAVISSGNVKKNLYGVLRAAQVLRSKYPRCQEKFVIWGIGTDAPEWQERLLEWKLRDRVELLGFLPDAEATQRLARSKLCVFLPLCEPFGLVAVEALQKRVPVLVSDHGGPAEILQRCGGGVKVDPLCPEAIADAVAAMLEDRQWLDPQSAVLQRAAVTAQEHYGWERYLDRTEAELRRHVS